MPEYLRALVLVTFWAHLRLGEVIALQLRDVDLAAGTVRVERQLVDVDGRQTEVTPKAASVRTVHLAEPGIEVLREHFYQHAADSRDVEIATPMGASASLSGMRGGTRRSTSS